MKTEESKSNNEKRFNGIKAVALIMAVAAVCALFNKCIIADRDSGISESYENTLDAGFLSNPYSKNGDDLAAWAQMACDNGWGYVYGTFGYVLDEKSLNEKSKQYPSEVGGNEAFIREHWLGRRTADCMGLIKSYMWYDPQTNKIIYAADTMPDIGCDKLFERASVKGGIKSIPEKKGIAVWCKGHIGIYIGNGYAIEAMSTKKGVKKTRIKKRSWTHWFEIPDVEYN